VSRTYTHRAHRAAQDRQAALVRKLNAEGALREAQAECHRTGAAWTADPDSDAAYAAYSRACDRFGDARQELAEARRQYDFAKFDAEREVQGGAS
jgi:hypothetical protein